MVSPRTVPSQVWTSSKPWWASAVLAGSSVAADARHQDDPAGEADDLDGGGHAQAGDPSSADAAGQAAQQDPGRGEQGRADHQRQEPGRDGALAAAVEIEDVGGGRLEDLGVLEDGTPGR
jgi:hypothetical protein